MSWLTMYLLHAKARFFLLVDLQPQGPTVIFQKVEIK